MDFKKHIRNKYLDQFALNSAIEEFIRAKDAANSAYSLEEINFINQYTGSGGLKKKGATGTGLLYEYYTPETIVQKMWGLAEKYGYQSGNSVLEPSCGIGRFLKYIHPDAIVDAFEISPVSARIAQLSYPAFSVYQKSFETLFFDGNKHLKDNYSGPKYHLVIGNPPYGDFTGKYAGMGEKKHTGASEYDHYFILRGLDLLKPGGLLIFIIPSAFLQNGSAYNAIKRKITSKAELIDAYRLPSGMFDTTDIGTDIVVFKRK